MTQEPKTIHVNADTELASVLSAADATPVRLERNGVVYRVSREGEDLWAHYDPEAIAHTLHHFAGTLTPAEGERLKTAIYRAREEGTRPAEGP
jgi:hypothetical protein